jgi:cytoskeleton protein RodZ
MTEAAEAGQAAGPGALLRRARELRGLTEQQAAEQLNLDITMVTALERNDLAALGAPVFAKGHLRRYGGLLGIGEHDLLSAYERASAQPEVPSLVPRSRQEMVPVRGRPKWPIVLGGLLSVLLAAGLVAYLSEYGLPWTGGGATDEGAATTVAAPAASASAVTGSDQTGVTVPAGAEVPADGSAVATPAGALIQPPVPPGHVSLTMSFAADSWTEIYDGAGTAVLYDLGRAGTERTIAAAAPLSVTFGNAPAVTLVVNGRAVKLPAMPAGQTVARFSVAPDGSLR